MLVYSLEMICIVAFALSGVLVESNRGKDIVSIMMLGWVTALGGGTLRDLILSAETIFWIRDPSYFWTALISAGIGFFSITHIRKHRVNKLIIIFDTIGVSLFSILVTQQLYSAGYAAYVAVSMGMVTAIFGGVLRDILAHRQTLFNDTELYATPVILGCCLYILLVNLNVEIALAALMCMVLIVSMRWYIVVKKICFPAFLLLK
ncbi:MAG: trimeric intracellular cation channel family protein [Moritella sp.]|uniref:trimeric intracellular cation channel family protein n=1 Tax=Moritella sp. TaxID=78556 RepID=UPI0029A7C19C|nr:trimeric intracellular cation channel family protein [Moritella sp.]MDX2322243.1 trimeric intracellular cation channel family protein [Moritella sp.]